MKTACHDRNRIRSRLLHCGIALLSLSLTQCDWKTYFLSCPDSEPNCNQGSLEPGPSDMDMSMDQDMSPDLLMPDTGPRRRFEWRASIPIEAKKMKYVGMKGTMPVFWTRNRPMDPSWKVYWTDLLQSVSGHRIGVAMLPSAGFPSINKSISENAELLVANQTFVSVGDGLDSINYLDKGSAVAAGLQYADPKKYFRDPGVDQFAVTVKSQQIGERSSVLLRWVAEKWMTLPTTGSTPTALVMGDLDGKPGAEAILFGKLSTLHIVHLENDGCSGKDDPDLETGLNKTLSQLGKGEITAGFLADLNGDKRNELIFSREDHLYFTVSVGSGAFMSWPGNGFSLNFDKMTGDTEVRSVSAVDLTSDGFPELVVETDKAVHFFLNRP